MHRCIDCMVPSPKTQDEINSKPLQFNEYGLLWLEYGIRGSSKDLPGKKFQSFQIIYYIIESFKVI